MNLSRNVLSKNFWEWSLIPLIVLSMTVSFIDGWTIITILWGFFVAFTFSIYFFVFSRRSNVPPEILIYFSWIVWSLTGMLHFRDMDLYLMGLRTIIQIGVMIFLVSGIVTLQRNISVVMSAIVIGGIIIFFHSYFIGEFSTAAIDFSSFGRVRGIVGNANSLAYHFLFVVFAVFCFWRNKLSRWQRIILLLIIAMCLVGIILSASRKMFFGLLVFILLWFWFCQRGMFSRKTGRAFLILFFSLGIVYALADFAMSRTYLGQRLYNIDLYKMSNRSGGRIQLYQEGFHLIKKRPFFGLGLDQFKTVSASGGYSHSDYLEVAVSTGIVGFAIYFSIYVVLWRRLNRIRKMTDDESVLYMIGFIKAAVITILLIAFGRPNIISKVTWIFLASAIGYSWSIENILLSKLFYAKRLTSKYDMPTIGYF